jgi:hypothetical protein
LAGCYRGLFDLRVFARPVVRVAFLKQIVNVGHVVTRGVPRLIKNALSRTSLPFVGGT